MFAYYCSPIDPPWIDGPASLPLLRASLDASTAPAHYFVDEVYRLLLEDYAADKPYVAQYSTSMLPVDIYSKLTIDLGYVQAHRLLSTEPYAPLVECLTQLIGELKSKAKIDGIVSFAHRPSLHAAAARHGLHVVDNELAPLPASRHLNAAYANFKGLSGIVEARDRYRQFACEFAVDDKRFQTSQELRNMFLGGSSEPLSDEPQYEAGVDIQSLADEQIKEVYDGWSYDQLLPRLSTEFGCENILVRNCRLTAPISSGFAQDKSENHATFVMRCKKIYTLDPGVAAEAILRNRDVELAGIDPIRMLVELPAEEKLRSVNFFFVNFLAPASILFQGDYYRWRLGNPQESQIWNMHLRHHYEAAKWARMENLQNEVLAMSRTFSWRITAPLRQLRSLMSQSGNNESKL